MPSLNTVLYCFLGLFLFLIACNASKASVKKTIDEPVDYSKIMVLLKKEVSPATLEEIFKAYEFKAKGMVSRRENWCMYTYNLSLIDGHKLLGMVQNAEEVLEAKFPEIVRKPKVTN